MFGAMLAGVDHLPHTHDLAHNAFSRGLPDWGAHLADELERLVTLHDASTIAAVIVEPIAGSTGVLMPPQGYLQRLREICDKHGIVLIFDEVITGFGRTGEPFAAQSFGVTPDLITCAKGLTSGAIPMGGVLATKEIYDTFMTGPENMIEFFHGYTYSGHPMAVAAGLAALDVYAAEGLFQRVTELAPVWEDAIHSLKGLPHVIDLRNYGLVGAVELEPVPGAPMKRAMDVFAGCWEEGVLIRTTGDNIALSPPFVIDESQIAQIVDTIGRVLKKTA
ncbi:MAG: aminotransferase class III-fold pyridoxal phosphate-dependent enzyme [Chromatiales bacterium]